MKRQIVLLVATALLGACASLPRNGQMRSSVSASPGGTLWVLVGSEQGVPRSRKGALRLFEAWSSAAAAACGGSYIGAPAIQVTSFALPGQPFADPFAPGTPVRLTAALGNAQCTTAFASALAP